MTEQDLIDLGFERFTETPENGGFHYYTFGELLSNDNEIASETDWIVTLYGELYDYHFKEIDELSILVNLLEKNKSESGFDINSLAPYPYKENK